MAQAAGHVYALLADGSIVEIRPCTGRGIRSSGSCAEVSRSLTPAGRPARAGPGEIA
jgi:hypothetical protein